MVFPSPQNLKLTAKAAKHAKKSNTELNTENRKQISSQYH